MKNNFTLLIAATLVLANLVTSCKKNDNSEVSSQVSGSSVEGRLTVDETNAYIARIDNEEKNKSKRLLEVGWNSREFTRNGKKLKFNINIKGEKPSDGRSLYISMHGGGNTTKKNNDEQWNNQIKMMDFGYGIGEGVLVVPRAPVDDWNMWFQSEIDDLFEDVIRAAVLLADVNPNKVYIMGYSAGGDGTYRLATRLADHWAAASMSAGHPGESNPVNLRNIGFALNMGGKDANYNRNGLARDWKVKLDNLEAADPEGYKHMVNIFEENAHWMDMKDKIAIPFMKNFKRKPYSNKIIWTQNSFRIRQYFYWVGISQADMRIAGIADNPGKIIKVSYHGNNIYIDENYAKELYIYLNDKMMDLEKDITITYKGTLIFRGKVKRSKAVIEETAAERKDSDYIFSAKLTIVENARVTLK